MRGSAENEVESLPLAPSAIEAVVELGEVALQMLRAHAASVPRSRASRFPKTT
jgi:hypothetical protein